MQLRQWIIALTIIGLISSPWPAVQGMEVSVGNIRVKTAPNGELYVNTSRGRIYLPSDDDYYEDGDYYDDDYYNDDYYYDDDYCYGSNRVSQSHVQRSGSGRQESYSSVYTSNCR